MIDNLDKTTFMRLLTDDAARPDPVFLSALQKKVVSIAHGSLPPSPPRFSATQLIVAGIISTAAVAGVVAGIVGHDSQPPAAEESIAIVASEPEVLSDVDAGEADVAADDEPEVANEQADQTTEPTAAVQPQAEQPQSADNTSSSTPVTDPVSDPDPVTDPIPNQNFSVSFWTVPQFKISPIIPSTPADAAAHDVAQLDYAWGDGSPDGAVTKNHFVARAAAEKYLEPGKYALIVNADDGVRVYINGKLHLDRWSITPGGKEDTVSFAVQSKDDPTKIVIEYFEFQGSAHLSATLKKQ